MPHITFEGLVTLMQTDELWYQKVHIVQEEISKLKKQEGKEKFKKHPLKSY